MRTFPGKSTARPASPFFLAKDGYLYGTISGLLLKMNPSGIFTTTMSYDGVTGTLSPAGMIMGRDGKFFGIITCGTKGGCILKINSNGKFSTLAKIGGTNENFQCPSGEITEASDGNFYGINYSHRTVRGYVQNVSTIFRLKPDGKFTNIFEFMGARPNSALVQGRDGNIYGTTEPLLHINQGTIFRFTPDNR